MGKKLILKDDFVIPKGTDIATSKDTTMDVVINEDELECSELFEISE